MNAMSNARKNGVAADIWNVFLLILIAIADAVMTKNITHDIFVDYCIKHYPEALEIMLLIGIPVWWLLWLFAFLGLFALTGGGFLFLVIPKLPQCHPRRTQ
jgi:hypothetical protein